MEGRIRNLIGLELRSSLQHLRQSLLHLGIGSAVIGFRVVFLIPQTDSHRFLSVWSDEGNFVLESLLFLQQGNAFVLERAGEVRNTIGLQMYRDTSSKHGNLPWLSKTCDFR